MLTKYSVAIVIVGLLLTMALACGTSESTKIASANNVVFGTPTEMGEFIVFNSKDGEGDQIQFTLDEQDAHQYTLDADLVIEEMDKGRFTVLLDTPTVRTLTFQGDKSVRVWSPVSPVSSTGRDTFSLSKEMHLRILVDLRENSWSIVVTEDDQEVLMDYTGFLGATHVRSIRFSTSVLENPEPVKVTVRNIVISSSSH